MSSNSPARPHVLIVGAGLAGLTFAQALRKQGVTFEIFEEDAAMDSRFQGFAITLHRILAQLNEALPDDMPPYRVTDHLRPLDHPSEFVMYQEDGTTTRVSAGKERSFIRANRSRLRDWLATNIKIQFGMSVTKVEERDSKVFLTFSDGSTTSGDILVGADGVRSVVRSHIFKGAIEPEISPVAQVVGEPTLNEEEYKRQLALGLSAYIFNRNGVRMYVGLQKIADDAKTATFCWCYSWIAKEVIDDTHWTRTASQQEMWDYTWEKAKLAGPELSEIVKLTRVEDIKKPAILLRTVTVTEMPNTRITLLGDSAHAMTPHRGQGGNHAMQDSINLAAAIAKSTPDTILPLLKEYQDEMLERGAFAVKHSQVGGFDNGEITIDGWRRWVHEGTGTDAIYNHR